ncbi:SecDF P1 head subdomain-containing protein [Microbispora sp. H11081]|uniref:SecDF P1 head subdomain-containing protein n=1 Tax=Microbispora sp. H11081 TaxID=2729107 RepID=UPI00147299B3|nr:hypothetical protein [Microbispora sp. H11081]
MRNAPVPGNEEPGPWPGGLTSGAETAPIPKAVGPDDRGAVPGEYDWFGGSGGGGEGGVDEETSVLPRAGDPATGDPAADPSAVPGEQGAVPGERGGVPYERDGDGRFDDPLGVPDGSRVPGRPDGPDGLVGPDGFGAPGGLGGVAAGPAVPVPAVEPVEPVLSDVPDVVVVPDAPGGTEGPGDGPPPAPAGPTEPRAARGTTIALVVALVLVVVMSGVLGAVAVVMTRNPDAPPLKQTAVRTLLTSVHFAPVTGVGPAPCTGTDAIPDDKGTSCYQLDPGVTVTTVQKIEEVPESDGTYSIRLVLSPSSQEQIAELTRETVKQQLAVVVGEKVVAAPRVAQEITQDSLGIAGFDKAQADAIMALLTGSAPPGQPQNPAASPPADTGQPGGTQPGGTQPGGTQPDGTQPGGTQPGGTQPGGTQPDGTQPGGTQPGGTQPGGTQPGGTQPGGTQPGGTQPTIEQFQ